MERDSGQAGALQKVDEVPPAELLDVMVQMILTWEDSADSPRSLAIALWRLL